MEPSKDQSSHEVKNDFSEPQELSALESRPEESPASDTVDTPTDHVSEPINTPVVDSANVSHTTDLPSVSEPFQPAEDMQINQQLKYGPYSGRYYPHHNSYRLSRDILREIAAATLDALDDGFYYPPATEVVDLVEVEQKEEGKEGTETKPDENKEEATQDGGNEKQDEQPETQDGSDEVHPEVEHKEVNIVNDTKVGREPYDLKTKICYTQEHTLFVPPDDENMSLWFQADVPVLQAKEGKKTRIVIAEYSTLVGTRKLQEITQNEAESQGKIGVLNFASAKKPGGGFLNGSQAQEESLARSSTLYPSLLTPTAKQFYKIYSADPDNAFYTHSMVYSPSVIVFRDDKGDWTAPTEVDILTCAAVNAGDVRKQVRWEEEMRALRERVRVAELARRRELSLPAYFPTHVRIYESEPQKDDGMIEIGHQSLNQSEQPSSSSTQVSPIIFASDPPSPPLEPLSLSNLHPALPVSQILGVTPTFQSHSPSSPYPHPPNVDPLTHAENLIAATMHERIARILYLFHLQGAKHLVLGSFGTGVFQNSVELIARIFRDLLCEPGKDGEEKEKECDQENAGVGEGVSPFVGINPASRGKFDGVFDTVMFAILGGSTVGTFKDMFEGVKGVEFDEDEDMKDTADLRTQAADACPPPA